MAQVKINNTLYEVIINGQIKDKDWNDRKSKTITFSNLTYAEVLNLFQENVHWAIVETTLVPQTDETGAIILDEKGNPTYTESREEYDNSEYSISGEVIDHRNGMVSIKMGKPTDLELAQEQLASGGTTQEYEDAYVEGVNSL